LLQPTPSQKGAVAEAEIAAATIRLQLVVLRPLCEGGRYDLAIDIGDRLLRVQCKWATQRGQVLSASAVTCRRTPTGYLRTTYSASEVDAIGLYAPTTCGCYLISIEKVEGKAGICLRLAPTRNNQILRVHWASDYELSASLRRNWGWDSAEQPLQPEPRGR
jgi:hypothetical protein